MFSCWFGSILCAMSLACVFAVMPIDKFMDNKIAAAAVSDEAVKASLLVNKVSNEEEEMVPPAPEPMPVSIKDVMKFSFIFWVLSVSCVTVYGEIGTTHFLSSLADRT